MQQSRHAPPPPPPPDRPSDQPRDAHLELCSSRQPVLLNVSVYLLWGRNERGLHVSAGCTSSGRRRGQEKQGAGYGTAAPLLQRPLVHPVLCSTATHTLVNAQMKSQVPTRASTGGLSAPATHPPPTRRPPECPPATHPPPTQHPTRPPIHPKGHPFTCRLTPPSPNPHPKPTPAAALSPTQARTCLHPSRPPTQLNLTSLNSQPPPKCT